MVTAVPLRPRPIPAFTGRAAGASKQGRNRGHNEDNFRVAAKQCLFAVADGMGGHEGGEIASALALDALVGAIATAGMEAPDEALRAAMSAANAAVRACSSGNGRSRMGCTLTALWLVGGVAVYGHVGDSRLYRLRGRRFELLTDDHNLAAEAVRLGNPLPLGLKAQLSSVLSRAVGVSDELEADVVVFDLAPGDRFMLCSDGVTDGVSDEVMGREVGAASHPAEAAEALTGRSHLAGPRGDDATVVVVDTVPSPNGGLFRSVRGWFGGG